MSQRIDQRIPADLLWAALDLFVNSDDALDGTLDPDDVETLRRLRDEIDRVVTDWGARYPMRVST